MLMRGVKIITVNRYNICDTIMIIEVVILKEKKMKKNENNKSLLCW